MAGEGGEKYFFIRGVGEMGSDGEERGLQGGCWQKEGDGRFGGFFFREKRKKTGQHMHWVFSGQHMQWRRFWGQHMH